MLNVKIAYTITHGLAVFYTKCLLVKNIGFSEGIVFEKLY